MKTKTLHIKFQSLDNFMDQGRNALHGGKPLVQAENEFYFSNVNSFESFMTGKKIHILSAIKAMNPDSIYSLAKLVNRDFANVFRDCAALDQHGFINFEDVANSKNSKKPVLAFDYDTIKVHLPTNFTYSHHIDADTEAAS